MLTHVDENHQPTMVDVSDKKISARRAVAESRVQLPEDLRPYFAKGEIHLKKGAVFQTAIIAGTMAAKRTADLIPFCHSLALNSCKLTVTLEDLTAVIRCSVKTEGKTGVEMEALVGACVAALTVYDMCKAVSHQITIRETKLIAKTGGRRTLFDRPLCGLVLTGGKSARMQTDKALLTYAGKPQALRAYELLAPYCEEVFLSARPGQWRGTPLEALPTIPDQVEGLGPMGGLLSALEQKPEAHWLVLACDLPKVSASTIELLLQSFDPDAVATCFFNQAQEFPEALCAVYTPRARSIFADALARDLRCPVKILKQAGGNFLAPRNSNELSNVNTPEEYAEAQHAFP